MGRVPSETGIDSDRGAWCADAHADAALPQCRSLYSPKREAKARDTGRVRNRDQGAIDMWPARDRACARAFDRDRHRACADAREVGGYPRRRRIRL